MFIAAFVEIARQDYAPTPGNYYDKSARDNITPCQDIDDYNPYQYQDYLAGVNDVDTKPAYCHQTCNDYYTVGDVTYLNLTCIDCDNIPQMSGISVFWQVYHDYYYFFMSCMINVIFLVFLVDLSICINWNF